MINLIVNGNSYSYPQPGDKANTGWGSQTTNWASAVTAALTALGLGGTLTPTPNAVVDISSTTKGILIPRLTTTQRNAITSPATSLLIFNTTLGVFQYYTGSAWITVGAKIPDNVQFDGTLLVNGNINTNGGVTAVGAVSGASLNSTGDANITGNANITGKALTGDGLVSAPTYSFINDSDTGLFRIGANNIGFAAGGVQTSQLNSFGVLNGTPGTDFRNLIKRQYNTLALGNPSTQSTSEVSTGIGFSYTPINAGSKLKINISITHQTSYNTQNVTVSHGFLRLYSTTGSIPAAGNSPTGTAISSTIINTRAYNSSPYLWDNSTHLNLQFWVDSLNINARNIYLVHSVGTSNLISTVYSTSYHSTYMVEEYI